MYVRTCTVVLCQLRTYSYIREWENGWTRTEWMFFKYLLKRTEHEWFRFSMSEMVDDEHTAVDAHRLCFSPAVALHAVLIFFETV
jgi:hypothetical protein